MNIKCISLHQPYASLIAHEFKIYETRSWKPPVSLKNELLAIHATKRYGMAEIRQTAHFCLKYPEVKKVLFDPDNGLTHPPLGAVVCVCRLIDYYPSDTEFMNVEEMEMDFGDWSPGRYVWKLKVEDLLDKPVLINGKQRLWEWEYK